MGGNDPDSQRGQAQRGQVQRGLVAAAIRGDAEAVRTLWQDHRRWVAAILLAHKPREAELDDLLQDVAMSFVRMIGKLRDESTLRPWLRTVAINAARAAGRETRRRRRFGNLRLARVPGAEDGASEGGTPAGVRADPGAAAVVSEEARRLLALACQIPEGYREPLLLRCLHGMNYQRIGELTGLPETTIETRIARGRRMLRELAAEAERDRAGPATRAATEV